MSKEPEKLSSDDHRRITILYGSAIIILAIVIILLVESIPNLQLLPLQGSRWAPGLSNQFLPSHSTVQGTTSIP